LKKYLSSKHFFQISDFYDTVKNILSNYSINQRVGSIDVKDKSEHDENNKQALDEKPAKNNGLQSNENDLSSGRPIINCFKIIYEH
jgi:hypothetical protein